MNGTGDAWFEVANVAGIASPAVLVYPDRVQANLRRLITMAGGPQRLRPHVKTHKLPELVDLQRALGIDKFKCATIAEAEMVAACGAPDVLLAYQPVGPNIERLLELVARFPATRFSAVVDCASAVAAISAAAHHRRLLVNLLLDVDCGMQRTGIPPGPAAVELYALMSRQPGVAPAGLHAYDGHLHDSDLALRAAHVETAMAPVHALRAELERRRLRVPRLVAGGTPSFPVHARNPDVECSPGTCVLWDGWSAASLPDLSFVSAAVVLTRVVSKPGVDRLCLDLGHKAIASEMPPPRVQFAGLPDAVAVMHNEEHLVLQTERAAEFSVGDVLYGIPWHICPTMALHSAVTVVLGGRATQQWKVVARDRALTI